MFCYRNFFEFPHGEGTLSVSSCCTVQVSPAFHKFVLHYFAFMKNLHLYFFSLTKRNPKRIFAFRKKDEKQKQHLAFVLQRAVTEAVHPEQWARPHQAPSPETTLRISPSAARASTCGCEHLAFICIDFVRLLARWALRYHKSLEEGIFGVWEHSKIRHIN